MQSRTKGLSFSAVISALAGAITIGIMAGKIDGVTEASTLGYCCMYLVVAVLFFALAGGFKENGQWNTDMMEIIGFVIIGLVLFAAIIKVFSVLTAVILIALAVLVICGIALSLKSENWFGQ